MLALNNNWGPGLIVLRLEAGLNTAKVRRNNTSVEILKVSKYYHYHHQPSPIIVMRTTLEPSRAHTPARKFAESLDFGVGFGVILMNTPLETSRRRQDSEL